MFHKLSGYGVYLFIKGLGKKFNKDDFEVIQLRFIDSCRFMASSLGKLDFNFDDNVGISENFMQETKFFSS